MRVLLLADAGCTTGFGRVSHAIFDRLVTDYGHDVHALATNYTGDYWPTPIKLYRPNAKVNLDIYGTSRYVEMLGLVVPDVVFMLNDPYVVLKFLFRNEFDTDFVLARARPFIAYTPVDGYEWPTTWDMLPTLVSRLPPYQDGPTPSLTRVAMSKFGQQRMPGSHLVYHGVDSDRYRPPTQNEPLFSSDGKAIRTKREAKQFLGMPDDSFLVLRVDRNSARKNFGDSWKALVPAMKRHSDIHVWFHCRPDGDATELSQVIARDPNTAERFHFPGQYSTKFGWPESELAILYAAADLFISTSWGEGFGLTLAEAASSGVPIIAQNVSSIPEVVGPGGVLIEPERPITVDSGQDQWLPNVPAFTEAIERLYTSAGARRDLGAAGRAHVVSSFSWDDAARQFDEIIRQTVESVSEKGDQRAASTAHPG